MSPMNSHAISSWEIDIEQPEDIKAVHQVNMQAFGRIDEAEVVDRLRQNSPVFKSYVARVEGRVVGHVLFTPSHIVQVDDWKISGLGLAPLAVTPEYQGQGIGSALCRSGLKRIDPDIAPFVIVLGHPDYYPCFGFKPASLHGICCSYADVPEACFMIRILDQKRMEGVSGVAYYQPEFDSVS